MTHAKISKFHRSIFIKKAAIDARKPWPQLIVWNACINCSFNAIDFGKIFVISNFL